MNKTKPKTASDKEHGSCRGLTRFQPSLAVSVFMKQKAPKSPKSPTAAESPSERINLAPEFAKLIEAETVRLGADFNDVANLWVCHGLLDMKLSKYVPEDQMDSVRHYVELFRDEAMKTATNAVYLTHGRMMNRSKQIFDEWAEKQAALVKKANKVKRTRA